MTYVINQSCVGTCDTACVDECPVDCILGPVPVADLRQVPQAERAQRFPGVQMMIDPDECINCGACASACPIDAIASDVHAAAADIERNAAFFRGRRAR